MPKVENVNFCCFCDLAFETRKQFIKHNLSDEHLNRTRKDYEGEVYNSDENDYVFRTKDNTKDIIKTKTETKTKGDDTIYTRIKYECKECQEEFGNKIALNTHS